MRIPHTLPPGETFAHSFTTAAKGYSVSPSIICDIVYVNGGRFIRTAPRAKTFLLYYNDPRQLAHIGTDIGAYCKGVLNTP